MNEERSYASKPMKLDGYLAHCASIEKNLDRRQTTNRFNLTLLVTLYTAYGVLLVEPLTPLTTGDKSIDAIILASILVISVVWVFQILRYREVSSQKFKVALELEAELGLNIVTLENNINQSGRTIISYTQLEVFVPALSVISSLFLLIT